jgi:hypothetical protein
LVLVVSHHWTFLPDDMVISMAYGISQIQL